MGKPHLVPRNDSYRSGNEMERREREREREERGNNFIHSLFQRNKQQQDNAVGGKTNLVKRRERDRLEETLPPTLNHYNPPCTIDTKRGTLEREKRR